MNINCESCVFKDVGVGLEPCQTCFVGTPQWSGWIPELCLKITDEKPGLMTEDRRCKTCIHHSHCWGAGLYDEGWSECAAGRADRRVENTVLKIHDEKPGLR